MPKRDYDTYGINPPYGDTRRVTRTYHQGENVSFSIPVVLEDGSPATRDNCTAELSLSSASACPGLSWTADLFEGVVVVSPGVLRVIVPKALSDTFRRGSLAYDLTIVDKRSKIRRVFEEGTLLIDYAAGSPNPTLGYKHADGDQTT